MKYAYSILIVFCITLLAEDVLACENCDQEINLDSHKWLCLEKKLPQLLDTKLKLVVFKLGSECETGVKNTQYKSADAAGPKISLESGKVYVVSKKQLICLSKDIKHFIHKKQKGSFKLSDTCDVNS